MLTRNRPNFLFHISWISGDFFIPFLLLYKKNINAKKNRDKCNKFYCEELTFFSSRSNNTELQKIHKSEIEKSFEDFSLKKRS